MLFYFKNTAVLLSGNLYKGVYSQNEFMKLIDKITPKNSPFFLGFLISLLGSLPLGYINVIGLQILLEQGSLAVISFISGVIFIQFFMLKTVSFGAKWFVKQTKLLLFIDVFTIIFFSLIAGYFITNIGNQENFSLSTLKLAQFPFILGLLLNSLNFIQWPYWSGIYIYLFRTEKLDPRCNDNSLFIMGVMLGTLSGMFVFAQTGKYILIQNKIEMSMYLNPVFASLFLVLAIIQIGKLSFQKKKQYKTEPISRN